MVTKEKIAVRLKALRKARGLTQAQIAAELGWSRVVVTKMEKGERSVSAEELPAVVQVYGAQIADLLDSGDKPADVDVDDLGFTGCIRPRRPQAFARTNGILGRQEVRRAG